MPSSKADLQTVQVDNHRSCLEFKKIGSGQGFFNNENYQMWRDGV